MDDKLIRVCLLGNDPEIDFRGMRVTFKRKIAQKLFVYLADSGPGDYSRAELSHLLFGDDENARNKLRKEALYGIPEDIRALCLDQSDLDEIHFLLDNIWVDTRAFEAQCDQLLQQAPFSNHEQLAEAEAALKRYKIHFLHEYALETDSAFDTSKLERWRRDRQRQLAKRRHYLFEEVIRYLLENQVDLLKVQEHAEAWLGSLEPGPMPLQCLIWIAANRHQEGRFREYLAQLKALEQQGREVINLSSQEWTRRTRVKDYDYIPLSFLGFEERQPPKNTRRQTTESPFGRGPLIDEILTCALSPDKAPFAIIGPAGVGKTEVARHVAARLSQEEGYKVVQLELNQELDLELLCNRVLEQLGRRDLVVLNYAVKQQRLTQLLPGPKCFVIVDEAYTNHFAKPKIVATVLKMLRGAPLMLVARQLGRFKHYVIDVNGFDEEQSRAFLVQKFPRLETLLDAPFKQLAELTGGLPLLLHMIAGFLKQERSRLPSLVKFLNERQPKTGTAEEISLLYHDVLSWLWQYVGAQERHVLFAVSLFDPTEGVLVDDVNTVCSSVYGEGIVRQKMNRLAEIRLLECRQRDGQEHYALHPIILEFIRGTQRSRMPYAAIIEKAYVQQLIAFVTTNVSQFSRLDTHKRNLIHLFDLVLFTDDHLWARPDTLAALNQVCLYLEKRGLYTAEERFLARALKLTAAQPSDATRVQLLHRAGHRAYKQANVKLANRFYKRALAMAEALGLMQEKADIYLSLALVQIYEGYYQKAEVNLDNAEKCASPGGLSLLLYRIWANAGLCAFHQSDFEKAERLYQKVRTSLGDDYEDLPEQLQDVAQYILTALGITYTDLENYSKALQFYQESISLARVLNNPERLGFLYLNLGVTYYTLRKYDAVHDCFLQGRMIAETIQHMELLTEIISNQGVLASTQNHHTKAFSLLNSALHRAEEAHLTRLEGIILVTLGKAYLKRHWPGKARLCFLKALNTQGISGKYAAQALYGLGLTAMVKVSVIGDNDVPTTYTHIQRLMKNFPLSPEGLPSITEDNLVRAQKYFQYDFDHPLRRYRIVEGLEMWLTTA